MSVGYCALALILFAAFITASLPYDEAISALVAPMRMKVVFERQRLNFPLGARLQNVNLISTVNQQLLLHSPEIDISLGVAWPVLTRPRLRVRGQIFGGMFDATIRPSERIALMDYKLDGIDLALLNRAANAPKNLVQATRAEEASDWNQFGFDLSGRLSGSGLAQVAGSDIIANRASMILDGRDVKATLVNGLPPLQFSVVHGSLLLENGVVSIKDVRAHGPDGDLKANGLIHLSPKVPESTIQLDVSVMPTDQGRASFGPLLNLLPHAPSDVPYHLEGALTFPSVS